MPIIKDKAISQRPPWEVVSTRLPPALYTRIREYATIHFEGEIGPALREILGFGLDHILNTGDAAKIAAHRANATAEALSLMDGIFQNMMEAFRSQMEE